MRMRLGEVRRLIKSVLQLEIGNLKGKLRSPGGSNNRQQFKIGKTEDENRELGLTQVRNIYPGAAELWAELASEIFPDHPFADDPQSMLMSSLWFDIAGRLRVAFKEMPQLELAEWDPTGADGEGDWIELDQNSMSAVA